MDKLTAIRTFAAPNFTPARHTKIFKDRWYRVRFQNVETDPRCDYVGLGEGEYTQVLPGNKAREARDACLNHCNGVSEYHGRVYALFVTQYGQMRETPEYFDGNMEGLFAAVSSRFAQHEKWMTDCAKELAIYQTRYEKTPNEHNFETVLSCAAVIQKYRAAFDYRLEIARA